MHGSQIDGRQRFLVDQINHGNCMVGTACAAVIGNVSRRAVGGDGNFVGIGPGGHFSHYLESGGIDDNKCRVAFVQHQE